MYINIVQSDSHDSGLNAAPLLKQSAERWQLVQLNCEECMNVWSTATTVQCTSIMSTQGSSHPTANYKTNNQQ